MTSPNGPSVGTLSSDDVVSLTRFTRKKAWIEEKIKFLETLPKVDPFGIFVSLAGEEEQVHSGEQIASREQVEQWATENDKLEGETEQFDTEEMSRLKKVAKAASKRELDNESTDLIDIALSTIISLDRLLHLLRSRANMLVMLGIRLDWEDQRHVAWRELRSLKRDVSNFVTLRGRWSATVSKKAEGTSPSSSPQSSPIGVVKGSPGHKGMHTAMSRFMQSEILALDSARLSTRIRSLMHSIVPSCGATLDKLIDTSRVPVPDAFLDEQEQLENEASLLNTQGPFLVDLVKQWRKADELSQTFKSLQADCKLLTNDVDRARTQQLTEAKYSAFASRCSTIEARLEPVAAAFGDHGGAIPRPMHQDYPDQEAANDKVVSILTSELASATRRVRQAVEAVAAYHRALEAKQRPPEPGTAAEETAERDKEFVEAPVNGSISEDPSGYENQSRELDEPRTADGRALEGFAVVVDTTQKESLNGDPRPDDLQGAELSSPDNSTDVIEGTTETLDECSDPTRNDPVNGDHQDDGSRLVESSGPEDLAEKAIGNAAGDTGDPDATRNEHLIGVPRHRTSHRLDPSDVYDETKGFNHAAEDPDVVGGTEAKAALSERTGDGRSRRSDLFGPGNLVSSTTESCISNEPLPRLARTYSSLSEDARQVEETPRPPGSSKSTNALAPRVVVEFPTGERNQSKPNNYRPNEKSKLDVAVSKILNEMPVRINMVPATQPQRDTWEDLSGRYWVRMNGVDKLVFCRILRSGMVMCRVGGGWRELHDYLASHSAEVFGLPDVSESPPRLSPRLRKSSWGSLPWLSSANLQSTSPQQATGLATPRPVRARVSSMRSESDVQSSIPRWVGARTPSRSPGHCKTPRLPSSPLPASLVEQGRRQSMRRSTSPYTPHTSPPPVSIPFPDSSPLPSKSSGSNGSVELLQPLLFHKDQSGKRP